MKKICLIGCLYKDDIYSHQCFSLVEALRRKINCEIRIVTSNCSCFSDSQKFACCKEELITPECEFIKIPHAPLMPSKKYGELKYYVTKLGRLNYFLETARGIAFYLKTKDCDVVHFHQVLKSFGFLSFLSFLILAKSRGKKVMVTVNEIDPLQLKYRKLNQYYNKTDKIFVYSKGAKAELVALGVKEHKIKTIRYGLSLPNLMELERDQFIFFGGHKLLVGKGFETVLRALKILKERGIHIKLVIYTGEGCIGLDQGMIMAKEMGLSDFIKWSEFFHGEELARAYQKSIGCIISYTGGSGRYPGTLAMANATPVIATRCADLPEYLGDLGLYIDEDSENQLVNTMIGLMNDKNRVDLLGIKMRHKAENEFGWDKVADDVFQEYEKVE